MLEAALRIQELRKIREQTQERLAELDADISEAEQEFINDHGQELPRNFVVRTENNTVIIEEG
ncbi:MAG: hypothetical protein FH749_07810 [Firmicutes bacterium]|nr:hypothetical protein [Bacillota bacterium]